MDRLMKKRITSAVLLVVTLVLNLLGALGVLNGLTQKEVSDRYPTLITPSGFTFSIWSVLYLLLIASVVVSFVKRGKPYYDLVTARLSPLFWLSCIFNSAWIIAFAFEQIGLSTIFIVLLLVVLTLHLKGLTTLQSGNKWLYALTFGLYTGWIFIATVVNIAAWLVALEWGAWGIAHWVWAIIIVIVAAVLAIAVSLSHRNAVFTLPIAWALFGIWNVHIVEKQYTALRIVTLIVMVVLIGWAAIQLYNNKWRIAPTEPIGRGEKAA